jgi:SAM-dependent methyltransferase
MKKILSYFIFVKESISRRGLWFSIKLIFWELSFDRIYGLETLSIVELEELQIDLEESSHAKIYQASNYFLLLHALDSLEKCGFQFNEKAIVDIGSGKGRVLILFAERGVKKCIGIEISSILNKIAYKNSQIWKKKNPNSVTEFTFVTIDASKYIFPDDVDLLYLANPFDDFILHQVIDSIKKSYLSNPREIVIIYMIPIHNELFKESSFQTLYSFQSDYIIYRFLESNKNEVS